MQRDCNTCRHHVQGVSIDDIPERCWTCMAHGQELPKWEAMAAEEGCAEQEIYADDIEPVAMLFADAMTEMKQGPVACPTPDAVNHPTHYTDHPSGIECIQITEHMGFNLGCAMKYLWRCDLKRDAIEDLEKAVWYIKREISRRGGTNGGSST